MQGERERRESVERVMGRDVASEQGSSGGGGSQGEGERASKQGERASEETRKASFTAAAAVVESLSLTLLFCLCACCLGSMRDAASVSASEREREREEHRARERERGPDRRRRLRLQESRRRAREVAPLIVSRASSFSPLFLAFLLSLLPSLVPRCSGCSSGSGERLAVAPRLSRCLLLPLSLARLLACLLSLTATHTHALFVLSCSSETLDNNIIITIAVPSISTDAIPCPVCHAQTHLQDSLAAILLLCPADEARRKRPSDRSREETKTGIVSVSGRRQTLTPSFLLISVPTQAASSSSPAASVITSLLPLSIKSTPSLAHPYTAGARCCEQEARSRRTYHSTHPSSNQSVQPACVGVCLDVCRRLPPLLLLLLPLASCLCL